MAQPGNPLTAAPGTAVPATEVGSALTAKPGVALTALPGEEAGPPPPGWRELVGLAPAETDDEPLLDEVPPPPPSPPNTAVPAPEPPPAKSQHPVPIEVEAHPVDRTPRPIAEEEPMVGGAAPVQLAGKEAVSHAPRPVESDSALASHAPVAMGGPWTPPRRGGDLPTRAIREPLDQVTTYQPVLEDGFIAQTVRAWPAGALRMTDDATLPPTVHNCTPRHEAWWWEPPPIVFHPPVPPDITVPTADQLGFNNMPDFDGDVLRPSWVDITPRTLTVRPPMGDQGTDVLRRKALQAALHALTNPRWGFRVLRIEVPATRFNRITQRWEPEPCVIDAGLTLEPRWTIADKDMGIIPPRVEKGVTILPAGGYPVVLRFRDPAPSESTVDATDSMLHVKRITWLHIRDIHFDGNRTAWPDEETSVIAGSAGYVGPATAWGGPGGGIGLLLSGCQRFWLQGIRCVGSRGNGIKMQESPKYPGPAYASVYARREALPVLDVGEWSRYGVLNDCVCIGSTDSAVAVMAAQTITVHGGSLSWSNGGETAAGVQTEGLTQGAVDDLVRDYREQGLTHADVPAQRDLVIRGVELVGNWKAVQVNGRWGTADITIAECVVRGGAARQSATIPVKVQGGQATIPPGGEWTSPFYYSNNGSNVFTTVAAAQQAFDNLEASGVWDSSGQDAFGVVASGERIRIGPSNTFVDWDNEYYPVQAMVRLGGGGSCYWVHDNVFQRVRHVRAWGTPATFPNQYTLVCVLVQRWTSGPIAIRSNRFFDVAPFRAGGRDYVIAFNTWVGGQSVWPSPIDVSGNTRVVDLGRFVVEQRLTPQARGAGNDTIP